MMGNLGATLDQIAWVSTGYIVANVIILPITGWLSAFFGRRRYFAGSIAIFVVSSFFCGNAHSLAALVFWRIIQGLGGGALLSTSQAILYEEFPREERSEEHTSELQSLAYLVCRLLLEKKKKRHNTCVHTPVA